jgi:DnaJ-domain-containing protein 1
MSRDDILFATLVLFCFGAALALTRSRQTRWLAKIVLLGVALAILVDIRAALLWRFDLSLPGLWAVLTPDRAALGGIGTALALMLRDRYAPLLSDYGLARARLQASAQADAERIVAAEMRRQMHITRAQLDAEQQAMRARLAAEQKEAAAIITREREKLRREREELEQAKQPDPYTVLGVPRTASRDELKRRYRALVAAYHPDKAVGATPEIRKLAEEKMKVVNLAFEQCNRN